MICSAACIARELGESVGGETVVGSCGTEGDGLLEGGEGEEVRGGAEVDWDGVGGAAKDGFVEVELRERGLARTFWRRRRE